MPENDLEGTPSEKTKEALKLINFARQNEQQQSFSNDKLANEELRHQFEDKKRGDQLRKHIHRVVIFTIYLLTGILLVLIIIRCIHFVTPTSQHWLDEKQIHDIERIIFAGTLVTVTSKYFKKYGVID